MKKKTLVIILGIVSLLVIVWLIMPSPYFILNKFKNKQTVEKVVQKNEEVVLKNLDELLVKEGLSYEKLQISILAFKKERQLIVYARNSKNKDWKRIKAYPFTGYSGKIGPKLKEGDRQIPEGIYRIEFLNPNSAYHLSLRVNYPNNFDKSKGKLDGRTNLGSDIMIHGKSVTIGCIPIGDKNVEELFTIAAKCIKNEIPVIIAPHDFRVNSQFPEVDGIQWEKELYKNITMALKKYE